MKTIKIISMIMLLLNITCMSAPPINDNIGIKPGEVYRLAIKGIPQDEKQAWSKDYKVDKKGFIQLPLGGKVKIEGKSTKDAQKAIEKHLVDKEIFTVPKIKLYKKNG